MARIDVQGIGSVDRTALILEIAGSSPSRINNRETKANYESQPFESANNSLQRATEDRKIFHPEARFVRDAVTETLVFQVIDMRRDEVIFQIPDETIMRMRRAYAEALSGARQG
ncbi:MAG: flagellar protein FlaG [Rhodobacteraceae bacterium]|nr:flagellar protein FlaG [Paracoccaceae bacterium]